MIRVGSNHQKDVDSLRTFRARNTFYNRILDYSIKKPGNCVGISLFCLGTTTTADDMIGYRQTRLIIRKCCTYIIELRTSGIANPRHIQWGMNFKGKARARVVKMEMPTCDVLRELF